MSGVIAQSFQHRLITQRIHAVCQAPASLEYRQAQLAPPWRRLTAKAQLQTFFDQAGEAGALLSGQRLRVGKQLVIDVERSFHDPMIQNSVSWRQGPMGRDGKTRGIQI